MTSRYGIGPNVGNRFVGGGAGGYGPNPDMFYTHVLPQPGYRYEYDATGRRSEVPISSPSLLPNLDAPRWRGGGPNLSGGGAQPGSLPTNPVMGGGARAYEPGMPTAGGAAGRFNPYNYDNATLQQMVLEKPEMARFLPPDVWAGFGNEFFTQNPQFMNQLSRERIRGTGTWAGRNTGFASDIAEQYAPGRAGIGTPQPKEFLGGAAPMPYVGGGGSATTRRPISYEDLMRNPATLPGLKGTFGGTDLRSPQSPFPRISPQDYANLMPIERAQLGAGLKGAGINPEDYYAQTERLTQAPNLEGTRRMPNVGRYGRYGGY